MKNHEILLDLLTNQLDDPQTVDALMNYTTRQDQLTVLNNILFEIRMGISLEELRIILENHASALEDTFHDDMMTISIDQQILEKYYNA